MIEINDEVPLEMKFYFGVNALDGNWGVDRAKDGDKLESIIQFLLINKKDVIEIGVHTDCMGREKYNERVSERKAEIITNEIAYRSGVEIYSNIKERIKTKGYGELIPITNCKCNRRSGGEHEINNRIMIKLTSIRN